MTEKIKLSDYVIRRIALQGVKHVFMLPGGGAMHLNDSLGKCRDIEYVCNLHEQASAIAAEAYARVTNNLGVCMVTSGPGSTNAVTGVAAAWLDSTPTLFLSGQVKRADLKRDTGVRQLGVQEVDITSIVKPITKYAVTIIEPESVRYHLEKALHLAKSGRPGPVWLDFPLDVQAAQIDPTAQQGYEPETVGTAGDGPLKKQVAAAAEWLAAHGGRSSSSAMASGWREPRPRSNARSSGCKCPCLRPGWAWTCWLPIASGWSGCPAALLHAARTLPCKTAICC